MGPKAKTILIVDIAFAWLSSLAVAICLLFPIPAHALSAQEKAIWANRIGAYLPDFQASARKALDRDLRDYPHTRFQNLRATVFFTPGSRPDGDRYVICGELNTRNAFGGYTGWQDFIISSVNGYRTAMFDSFESAPALIVGVCDRKDWVWTHLDHM